MLPGPKVCCLLYAFFNVTLKVQSSTLILNTFSFLSNSANISSLSVNCLLCVWTVKKILVFVHCSVSLNGETKKGSRSSHTTILANQRRGWDGGVVVNVIFLSMRIHEVGGWSLWRSTKGMCAFVWLLSSYMLQLFYRIDGSPFKYSLCHLYWAVLVTSICNWHYRLLIIFFF